MSENTAPSKGLTRLRFAIILVKTLALQGCITTPRSPIVVAVGTLRPADDLMRRTERLAEQSELAAGYRLRAAEMAWNELSGRGGAVKDMETPPAAQQHALRILAASGEGLAPLFVGDNTAGKREFLIDGFRYRVVSSPAGKDRRLSAREPPVGDAGPRHSAQTYSPLVCGRGRWGTVVSDLENAGRCALAALRHSSWLHQSADGYARFHTVKARSARVVTLTAYDPTAVSPVRRRGVYYPLAADFTAPNIKGTLGVSELLRGLGGLLNPGPKDAALGLLEPYDHRRIPVVFVHGLYHFR